MSVYQLGHVELRKANHTFASNQFFFIIPRVKDTIIDLLLSMINAESTTLSTIPDITGFNKIEY